MIPEDLFVQLPPSWSVLYVGFELSFIRPGVDHAGGIARIVDVEVDEDGAAAACRNGQAIKQASR